MRVIVNICLQTLIKLDLNLNKISIAEQLAHTIRKIYDLWNTSFNNLLLVASYIEDGT